MFKLTITKGPDVGRVVALEEPEVTIGREPGAGGLVLSDASVSRRHSLVRVSPESCVLEDLGSRNGTLVNGKKVDRAELHEGDVVQVGETSLRFTSRHMGCSPQNERMAASYDASATISLKSLTSGLLEPGSEGIDAESCRRARDALAAAQRTGQVIHTFLDPDELFQHLLDQLHKEIPQADYSAVLLKDRKSGVLECRARCSKNNRIPNEEDAFSLSLAHFALQEDKAVLVHDVQKDRRFQESDSVRAANIQSAVAVPLTTHRGLQGLLYVDSRRPRQRFFEEDARLLAMIGLQASTAIENAELYRSLAKEKEALHAAHESLKAAQANLVRSEKLAAVGQLASGVVHDVRNPLTVILGHAQILRMHAESHDLTPECESMLFPSLDEIEKGVAHANEIVDQLLHFTRQTKPKMVRLQIDEVVNETLRFLKAELVKSKIVCEPDFESSIPAVRGDRNQLKQVLINIVMNAIQAMGKEGGRLTVVCRTEQHEAKTGAVISLRDNGIGMDEETLAKIFDPFFTTKESSGGAGGSGLGLSVGYGIIQAHGGDIEVESRPGAGTCFTIWLPEAAEDPEEAAPEK